MVKREEGIQGTGVNVSKGELVGDMMTVLWGGEWRTTGPLGHKEWKSRWQTVEKMGLERLTRAPSLGLVTLGDSFSRALL